MSTLDTVLAWRPADLDGVVDRLLADRRALVALQDEVDAAAPPPTWTGRARDAAARAHRDLTGRLAGTVAEVALVATSTDEAAASLTAARAELDAALVAARAHDLHLDRATGQVTDRTCTDPVTAGDRALLAAELTDRLEQALRAADRADALLSTALHRAAAGVEPLAGDRLAAAALAGAGRGRHGVPNPPDGSPADTAAWWRTLSPAQQDRVLEEHPEWLGGADGIPFAVRDRANRALLPRVRDGLRAEIERLEQELERRRAEDLWLHTGSKGDLTGRMRVLRQMLDGLDAVERTLAERPDRTLLLLDASGERQLRAAVGVGDVDTAAHVGVFTPGFTSTVAGSMEDYVRSTDALRRRAGDEADLHGTGSVATVAWLGYEAPQWGEWSDPFGDFITSEDSARTGGAALATFLLGVDAARETDPHLTALGHSYGSTTTGFALREQTGVDAAVVFGSPGLGVSTITDLDVPAGSLYYIEARNDPVADLGYFGDDPSRMRGTVGLSAQEAVVGDHHYAESTGHSSYLRDGTTSQHNLGAVIAGVPDRLVRHHGNGLGDALAMLTVAA